MVTSLWRIGAVHQVLVESVAAAPAVPVDASQVQLELPRCVSSLRSRELSLLNCRGLEEATAAASPQSPSDSKDDGNYILRICI